MEARLFECGSVYNKQNKLIEQKLGRFAPRQPVHSRATGWAGEIVYQPPRRKPSLLLETSV